MEVVRIQMLMSGLGVLGNGVSASASQLESEWKMQCWNWSRAIEHLPVRFLNFRVRNGIIEPL